MNPLDHISLSKNILVLRKEQIEKLILPLTDGDIKRASSLADQMVYKASPFMLKRFKIEKVPSIVTQEGRKLRIEEKVLK